MHRQALNYLNINREFKCFEIIINILAVSASFEYLCHGSTAIINIFNPTVRQSTLDVRI